MTTRAHDVLREALALPLDERADVAAELLASLDAAAAEYPADVEAAWGAEIERRAPRSCVHRIQRRTTSILRNSKSIWNTSSGNWKSITKNWKMPMTTKSKTSKKK
jgi:hypothetical protein